MRHGPCLREYWDPWRLKRKKNSTSFKSIFIKLGENGKFYWWLHTKWGCHKCWEITWVKLNAPECLESCGKFSIFTWTNVTEILTWDNPNQENFPRYQFGRMRKSVRSITHRNMRHFQGLWFFHYSNTDLQINHIYYLYNALR